MSATAASTSRMKLLSPPRVSCALTVLLVLRVL
jgi:hypothetical protein